jgi:hypothetical protein
LNYVFYLLLTIFSNRKDGAEMTKIKGRIGVKVPFVTRYFIIHQGFLQVLITEVRPSLNVITRCGYW